MKTFKTLAVLALFASVIPAHADKTFNGIEINGLLNNGIEPNGTGWGLNGIFPNGTGWGLNGKSLNGSSADGVPQMTVYAVTLPDEAQTDAK